MKHVYTGLIASAIALAPALAFARPGSQAPRQQHRSQTVEAQPRGGFDARTLIRPEAQKHRGVAVAGHTRPFAAGELLRPREIERGRTRAPADVGYYAAPSGPVRILR